MVKQLHIRIRNLTTRESIEQLAKEQNVPVNNIINNILDEYFLKEDIKSEFKEIKNKLELIDKKCDDTFQGIQNTALIDSRNFAILLAEHNKNCLELKEKGKDPGDYYECKKYEGNLIPLNNEFEKELQEFVDNWMLENR